MNAGAGWRGRQRAHVEPAPWAAKKKCETRDAAFSRPSPRAESEAPPARSTLAGLTAGDRVVDAEDATSGAGRSVVKAAANDRATDDGTRTEPGSDVAASATASEVAAVDPSASDAADAVDAREAVAAQAADAIAALQSELEKVKHHLELTATALAHVTEERDAVLSRIEAVEHANACELGDKVLTLAVAVAERVVGHAVETNPALLVAWAHETLASLDLGDDVMIALSPAAAERISKETWQSSEVTSALAERGARPPETRVDHTLSGTSCEIRSDQASVEVSPKARLAEVAEHLGVPVPEAA